VTKSLKNDLERRKGNSNPIWPDLYAVSRQITLLDTLPLDNNDLTKSVKTTFLKLNLEPPKPIPPFTSKSKNLISWGFGTMAFFCVALWGWIYISHSNVNANLPAEQSLTDMSFLEASPLLEGSLPIQNPQNHPQVFQTSSAYHWLYQGKKALKNRQAPKALVFFAKAKKNLSNPNSRRSQAILSEINQLQANAYYLNGFIAMQNNNYCTAKSFFESAKLLAPLDPKISARLNEISLQSRC